MDRQLLAYLLIALLIAAVAGAIAYGLYNSHTRTYRRRIKRENVDYARQAADRER